LNLFFFFCLSFFLTFLSIAPVAVGFSPRLGLMYVSLPPSTKLDAENQVVGAPLGKLCQVIHAFLISCCLSSSSILFPDPSQQCLCCMSGTNCLEMFFLPPNRGSRTAGPFFFPLYRSPRNLSYISLSFAQRIFLSPLCSSTS